jgi:hypothetical protein
MLERKRAVSVSTMLPPLLHKASANDRSAPASWPVTTRVHPGWASRPRRDCSVVMGAGAAGSSRKALATPVGNRKPESCCARNVGAARNRTDSAMPPSPYPAAAATLHAARAMPVTAGMIDRVQADGSFNRAR